MKSKTTTVLVIGALLLVIILVVRGGNSSSTASSTSSVGGSTNVATINGQQIVTINVKGGYQPRTSVVKAGVPIVLRFETNNTFDCSSAMRIPSLDISQSLPPTGTTDVVIGALSAGTLQGMCGMGMYRFDLEVQS